MRWLGGRRGQDPPAPLYKWNGSSFELEKGRGDSIHEPATIYVTAPSTATFLESIYDLPVHKLAKRVFRSSDGRGGARIRLGPVPSLTKTIKIVFQEGWKEQDLFEGEVILHLRDSTHARHLTAPPVARTEWAPASTDTAELARALVLLREVLDGQHDERIEPDKLLDAISREHAALGVFTDSIKSPVGGLMRHWIGTYWDLLPDPPEVLYVLMWRVLRRAHDLADGRYLAMDGISDQGFWISLTRMKIVYEVDQDAVRRWPLGGDQQGARFSASPRHHSLLRA